MASNSESLEKRILQAIAKKSSELPPDDFEEPNSHDEEEEIEEIEEISENELLRYLDAQEDPLGVAQQLFYNEVNSTQSQAHSEQWNLSCLSAKTVEDLYGHGWTFVDDLIDLEVLKNARQDAEKMREKGEFCSAGAHKAEEDDPYRDNDARDDKIRWLNYEEKETLPLSFQNILDFFQSLQQDLAKMMHLNGQTEYQLAYYHKNGARYERHRDALPTDDKEDSEQRRVTAILYLNPGWTPGDGGQLKIFGQPSHEPSDRDIPPLLGRVVLFLSGVVDHAVMAAKKDRFAITAWMR